VVEPEELVEPEERAVLVEEMELVEPEERVVVWVRFLPED
jgi:hypothetical protein